MLDDVLNAGGAPPAGVFVDFVYMGQGGPADGFAAFVAGIAAATRASAWADRPACVTDPLMKLACIVAAGGTPIVLAKPSPADLDLFTDVQRQLDRVAVLAPALVGEQAYPTITDYGFDAGKAARLAVHRFDVSPAMALYAAWCLKRQDACGIAGFKALQAEARKALGGAPAGGAAGSLDLTKTFDAPLDVVWGSRPRPPTIWRMTEAVSGRKPALPAGRRRPAASRLMEQMAGLRAPAAGTRGRSAPTR